mmetsp:Transcript_31692/g.48525  ORF Transcript_31692/g.48525 Transcript_31692/m.48525 type:complete len:272 (+) Transcript_31692:913-1728(+)
MSVVSTDTLTVTLGGYSDLGVDATELAVLEAVGYVRSSASPDSSSHDSASMKIYQAVMGNMMHRPIFGVQSSEPSKIYRLTIDTQKQEFLTDADGLTNFFDYPIYFGRFRAISLQPGSATDTLDALDYNKMKIIILNLRDLTIEQKIVITKPGCGDGKYDSSLGTEECDDGNAVNGDGCDQNCVVEDNYSCTTVEGATSVCSYIYCGDGKVDADQNEECDDGNTVDNDGCTSCLKDNGYDCTTLSDGSSDCTNQCGDGEVYIQSRDGSVIF